MTTVQDAPAPAELLPMPPGHLNVFGIVRTRNDWEHLEQVFYYLNAGAADTYSLETCIQQGAGLAMTAEEWELASAHSSVDWMEVLGRALDDGCTPYRTADEMKVAARNFILSQRARRDWCGEGTNVILGRLGLEGLEPSPFERQEFIDRFRKVVNEHYAADGHEGKREGWVVRSLLRGRYEAPATPQS